MPVKIKGSFYKIMNIRHLISISSSSKPYHFQAFLIWRHSPFLVQRIILQNIMRTEYWDRTFAFIMYIECRYSTSAEHSLDIELWYITPAEHNVDKPQIHCFCSTYYRQHTDILVLQYIIQSEQGHNTPAGHNAARKLTQDSSRTWYKVEIMQRFSTTK